MGKLDPVPRPTKKSEHKIYFATTQAEKGWRDLTAVRRNDLVTAWEYLTKTPLLDTPYSHQLRGELDSVIRDGKTYDCRQLKLSLKDGARIWYYVDELQVHIIKVFTAHPNMTK